MAEKKAVLVTSPKMRYVQGDVFTPSTEDMQGNRMTIKQGPNAGQETQSFIIVGAIAKTDPAAIPYIMQLCEIAKAEKPALWPTLTTPAAGFAKQYVQGVAQLFGCTHPQYALKVQDGDGYDGNGQPNWTKEGHAGHWIIKFSQPSAIKVYEAGKYDNMDRVDIDPAKHTLLKRGYYVRVGAMVQGNGNDQRPGLYLNPNMVEIVHAGEEITTGPDAYQVFSASPPPVTTTSHTVNPPAPPAPPAAAGGLVPNPGVDLAQYRAAGWTDDQLVQNGLATRSAPLPVAPPPAPPAVTPAAPPPPAPPATPSPSSPPPPPYSGFTRVMLPAANGQTYDAMIASGWTDALLIQHGMMSA